MLIKAGRTADLLALVQRYIEEHPADDTSRLALALKLAPQHPSIALDMLQSDRADWLVWRSWRLSSNVAWLYLQQGLPQEALPYATNALALNSDDQQVKSTHARALQAVATDCGTEGC